MLSQSLKHSETNKKSYMSFSFFSKYINNLLTNKQCYCLNTKQKFNSNLQKKKKEMKEKTLNLTNVNTTKTPDLLIHLCFEGNINLKTKKLKLFKFFLNKIFEFSLKSSTL